MPPIPYFLRRPRFGQQQPEFMEQFMPQEEPEYAPGMDVTTNVPPEESGFGFKYPEQAARPMFDAYSSHINAPPERGKTGVLRKILAALVAGGGGLTGRDGAAMGAGVLEAPFQRKMFDWKTRGDALRQGAELEGHGLESRNRFFRDFNQTRAQELDATRDFERGERDEARAEREERRQGDISAHYDRKSALDREEFEARKAGGYFNKYPPKYIANPGGGSTPKPPTQTNMRQAEQEATNEALLRVPNWERFVHRDPYSKRVTAIVGLGENPTSSDAVEFEKFMIARRHLAERRLRGGLGLPNMPSVGSQTSSSDAGPDPDYEY